MAAHFVGGMSTAVAFYRTPVRLFELRDPGTFNVDIVSS